MSPEAFDIAMAAALRGGATGDLLGAMGGDAEGLARYVRHYRAACIERLGAEYPGVRAALGEAAFNAQAAAYGRATQPDFGDGPRFGAGFCDWLTAAEPALPSWALDIARLDWRMEVGARAPLVRSLERAELGAADLSPETVLRIDPAAAWVRSGYRISDWYAAMLQGRAPPAPEVGEDFIEARRGGRRVVLRELSAGEFAFREALGRRETLGAAARSALAADARIDLAAVLTRLADEGLAVAVEGRQLG